MNNRKSNDSITLLNFEGPVLWAVSKDTGIAIYDQWNELVEVFSIKDFCSFLDGEITVRDSRENSWVYTEQHQAAKPNTLRLYSFLSDWFTQ
jgi:hypothetical protein